MMLIVEWWKDKHALPLCNALCGHAVASPVFGPDNKPRCAICGAADAKFMHHLRWRDCCPDTQLQWSACERTRTRAIPPRIRHSVKYASLEELLSDAAMGDGRNLTCIPGTYGQANGQPGKMQARSWCGAHPHVAARCREAASPSLRAASSSCTAAPPASAASLSQVGSSCAPGQTVPQHSRAATSLTVRCML
eukprot:jgi/Ulvmu1/6308/UM029_0015.1